MSSIIFNILNNAISANNSYLELGVYQKVNFNQVHCIEKDCVDINPQFSPTYHMSTDDFFVQNKKQYDIIFIDANHDLPYVIKDFNNSIKICKKMIAIHDMYPPNEGETVSSHCSDSFKLLAHFKKNNVDCITLNGDYGLTFIFPPFKEAISVNEITYKEFIDMKISTFPIQYIINSIKERNI